MTDLLFFLATLAVGLALGGAFSWLLRRRPDARVAMAVGVLCLWPVIVLLANATTCTGGDDDSWWVTLWLGSFFAGLAIPPMRWRPVRSRAWLAVPVLTVVPLLFYVDHMIQTGLGAHHLCGPEYDGSLTYGTSQLKATIYYPMMWGYGLLLSTLAILAFVHGRPRHTPG
ncbi:MAG: hypothetical protein AAGI52_08830 [Bacteroidota bacterium]